MYGRVRILRKKLGTRKTNAEGSEADADADMRKTRVGTVWLARSDARVSNVAPAAPNPPGLVTLSKLGCKLGEGECYDCSLSSKESIRQHVPTVACLESGLESCDAESS
uniref:Uncharacterized protein n=1 Tax=Physcomitrium patens TaxID=3218 RepID=A0A2K1JZP0_PHYPA|nr:hypothetical protein PHYPA_014108 [Physcomitrium patens]